MLKKLLENNIGQSISNTEFTAVMDMTSKDIKFNNIRFGKRTKVEEMLNIAVKCVATLKRCL
ncbi:hypothetical protein [Clostridium magnum]|uniref:Uncharacterized protein n=1 Tax=Clostridium magnum DSM 2767 TaxID=1121326 RepID=A0A162UVK5_9CLOT|nr:hypothetical protein [Clostridium magnum]KZL94330.1 hypothetical protein CLMAG_13830 [Clostridium magnum DSM 2767]SHJ54753.1 hypothetical protein SAMN02745944_06138 [Clostridium magnum DSM 2767]